MRKPTIIEISGPPTGYKSTITGLIANWIEEYFHVTANELLSVEEAGLVLSGNKDTAEFQIIIKQTF